MFPHIARIHSSQLVFRRSQITAPIGGLAASRGRSLMLGSAAELPRTHLRDAVAPALLREVKRPCAPAMLAATAASARDHGWHIARHRRASVVDLGVPGSAVRSSALPQLSACRRLSTASSGLEKSVPEKLDAAPDASRQPPLLVRAGLVASTTALLTPIFPIIGFNQLVFRFADPVTKTAIHGGTSMLYFSCMVLVPKAFYFAPVLLPFAIGNGVTAGSLYMLAEAGAGGPQALAAQKVLGIPVAGAGIGLVTAMLVPFTYPLSWGLVFPEDVHHALDPEIYNFIWNVCFNGVMVPCLAMTGLAVGAMTHFALKPLILGVQGTSWHGLAGGILAASVIALVAMYSTTLRLDIAHLKELDLQKPELNDGSWFFTKSAACFISGFDEFSWVPRLDLQSGTLCSERCPLERSGQSRDFTMKSSGIRTPGLDRAEEAQDLLKKAHDRRVRVYSSRRQAFFDLFHTNHLGHDELSKITRTLSVGEALLTDATVILAASGDKAHDARHTVLARSLEQALPLLRETAPAAWSKGNLPALGLRKSWLNEQCPDEAVRSLMKIVGVRAAQLRELLRLEEQARAYDVGGQREDSAYKDLRNQLQSAGIDVASVQKSLSQMDWRLDKHDSAALRKADKDVLRQDTWERRTSKASNVLVGSAVGAVVFGGAAWLAAYLAAKADTD